MVGILIIFCATGLLILVLSYLIKYKKQAQLISGYDESLIADKDGFCSWIGGVLMWPGIYAIITGVLLYSWPESGLLIALSFGVFTITACFIAVAGSKKFKKRA